MQRKIAAAVGESPRTSVRSCHGVGKTYIAAAIGIWHLYSFPDSILLTTAPTWRQVKELLWREIRSQFARAGMWGKCNTTDLQLSEKWFALGLSTDDPDRFQGFHSDHILLIVDEAAGVPQTIFDAAEGILTTENSRELIIGNPTSNSGLFYDSHHTARDAWSTFHIDALESPNFTDEKEKIPKDVAKRLVTPEWVEGRKAAWGEDSPIYQARVRGNFPEQAEDSLISLAWIIFARDNSPKPKRDDAVVAGVDIARSGACESAIYVRKGDLIIDKEFWRNADTVYTANRILAVGKRNNVGLYNIDATGVGGGVIDMLRAKGINGVCGVHVGSASLKPDQFACLRDQLWWNLRTILKNRKIGPLTDEKTQAQLTAMKYEYTERSKIKIESKEDLRDRGQPSPDRADALVLCFAPKLKKSLKFS